LHPKYFIETNREDSNGPAVKVKPLLMATETTKDVVQMIQSVFVDITGGVSSVFSQIAKEMKKSE